RVVGYRNICPHIGTPLDLIPGEFLTWDKAQILCRTHGARFRIDDGLCVSGPCRGRRLAALTLRVADGRVAMTAPLPPQPPLSEAPTQPAKPAPAPTPPAKVPEIGGPKGPEPTRYGDWEINGRCIDF